MTVDAHDVLNVVPDDLELRLEMKLTAQLMSAANKSPGSLRRHEVDKLLGLANQ